jgi:hypothetical protein
VASIPQWAYSSSTSDHGSSPCGYGAPDGYADRRGPETGKRALDLGVVGGELVAAERPVDGDAVRRADAEVVGAQADRDRREVDGRAADGATGVDPAGLEWVVAVDDPEVIRPFSHRSRRPERKPRRR